MRNTATFEIPFSSSQALVDIAFATGFAVARYHVNITTEDKGFWRKRMVITFEGEDAKKAENFVKYYIQGKRLVWR